MNSEFHLAVRRLTPEEAHVVLLELAHARQIVRWAMLGFRARGERCYGGVFRLWYW